VTRKDTSRAPDIMAIKQMVRGIDPDVPDESDPGFQAAVLVLAAVSVGPLVNALSDFTGYDEEFVSEIAARMTAAGLWSNNVVCSRHWLKPGAINRVLFMSDVMVAQGLLVAHLAMGHVIYDLSASGRAILDWTTNESAGVDTLQ